MGVAQFAREYTTVRRAEGWGSPDGAYYRALPFRDLSGRYASIWRIRARSYATLVERVLQPIEERTTKQLTTLDLGAGSGWLAYRLACRGHRVLAVDVLDDALDGLGATRHFGGTFSAALAEYDHLPLPDAYADVIIFNAALHYSTNYTETLRESLRVLVEDGTLVILDSPMYADPSSGQRMVQEREQRFLARYGFASNALPSEHFLTDDRLRQLAAELCIRWEIHQPALDVRSRVSRALNGLRARRKPASFPVVVGRRE
jgi:SAM-dependent methyltransferase